VIKENCGKNKTGIADKTQEFFQKLAPCIERGDPDACVEEAARMAREMDMGAQELLKLSGTEGKGGRYDFAYVLALAAAQGLEVEAKAGAYYNAGLAAQDLRQVEKAEEHYKLAIAANPNYVAEHSNYAILLSELNRKPEAEEQYKQAIAANPNDAAAHSNYAILLSELNRKPEAEEQYKQAIAANPNYAKAHGNYGILLIEFNKRKDAQREIDTASNIFKITGQFTMSYLARAWFYEKYSEKNLCLKNFRESGEDAEKAGDEYLNASETTEGELKDNLALQRNVLKAKSFVRKIPEKSWYRKILNKLGKNPGISELMGNLSEAAIYYEKASHCSIGERKDLCSACSSSIRVFSEILLTMSALIKNNDAEIYKDKWLRSLELAHKTYIDKKLDNGTALVDTLKQLIKCVDELAEHRKMGLHIQEERLGKCYNNLLEVSEKLEGALKVIAAHSVEAIRDYAKKQGMGFIGDEKPKKSVLDNWLIKGLAGIISVIILGIISGIIANRFFGYNWVLDTLTDIESAFRGIFNP
jgi:tetratricopeptide (TPR) repeat protein